MLSWDGSRKKLWLLLCTLLVISGVVLLIVFTSGGLKNQNSTRSTTEFIGIEEGKTFEVIIDNDERNTWLYVDGVKEELLTAIPFQAKPVLTLPKAEDAVDLEETEPTSILTWESPLQDSSNYINYLEKEGFTTIREVATPDYIELVLSKKDERKRVLIMENTLMIGGLDKQAQLTPLEEYLEKYRKIGGQKDA